MEGICALDMVRHIRSFINWWLRAARVAFTGECMCGTSINHGSAKSLVSGIVWLRGAFQLIFELPCCSDEGRMQLQRWELHVLYDVANHCVLQMRLEVVPDGKDLFA